VSIHTLKRKRGNAYKVVWRDELLQQHSRRFNLKRDAEVWEARVKLSKRQGELAALDSGRQLLRDFASDWRALHAESHLAPKALLLYDFPHRSVTAAARICASPSTHDGAHPEGLGRPARCRRTACDCSQGAHASSGNARACSAVGPHCEQPGTLRPEATEPTEADDAAAVATAGRISSAHIV
jgi:hypothetical protein